MSNEGIVAWALDFERALRQRPLWAKLLFRVIAGQYAYREFIGLQDALKKEGWTPYIDYGLEHVSYHSHDVPGQWWVEREPKPDVVDITQSTQRLI